MNELKSHGKYMDEFERVLYNGVLTGISLSGDNYTYQNPLVSDHHHRWQWHDCPCCPPMFLKMMGAMPRFIYRAAEDSVIVNLYVSSEASFQASGDTLLRLKQTTRYPWEGGVTIEVTPKAESVLTLSLRIPGWARGAENPMGLYRSDVKTGHHIHVNGQDFEAEVVNGYVSIRRQWRAGDKIELSLPVEPRLVFANDKVQNLNGMTAIAAGPLVYCVESNANKSLENIAIDSAANMLSRFDMKLLSGVNVISWQQPDGGTVNAIPYFAVGNARKGDRYQVWLPLAK